MTERLVRVRHPWYGSAAEEADQEENLAHLVLPDHDPPRPSSNNSACSLDGSIPLPIVPPHERRSRRGSSRGNFLRNVTVVCLSWVALTVTYHSAVVLVSTSSGGGPAALLASTASFLGGATPEELDLAHRYGGASSSSIWQIRRAQREADQARRALSSQADEADDDGDDDDNGESNKDPEDSLEPNSEEEESSTTGNAAEGEPAPERRRYLKKKALQSIKDHRQHRSSTTSSNDDNDSNDANGLPEGCESTVLILRHCEKGSIQEHCAYEGYERSVYLAGLFGNATRFRWPSPAAVFAQAPVQRARQTKMNFREIETVGPLARAAGVAVDDSYTDDRLNQLGRDILATARQGHLCGRVVVVAWKHSRIAHLARALGCGPAQGCPVDYSGKTFDQVWQVRLVYRQWPHSSTRKFVRTTVRHHSHHAAPSWKIFGSVQSEQFDPLAVSKQFGDYPPGGAAAGGHWQALEVAYPERQKKSDTAGWRVSRVGLPRTAPAHGDDNNSEISSSNSENDVQIQRQQQQQRVENEHDGQN